MKTGYFFDVILYKIGMKKRLFTLVLATAALVSANAQLNGAGYYRVKNASSNRYMSLVDNTSRGVSTVSTSADCGAMATSSVWDNISHDPGSVFYLEHISGESYNVVGQGTSLHDIINYYIYLTPVGSHYKAWQQESGQRVTLTDNTEDDDVISYVTTTGTASNWDIIPIDATNNYIGVKPTVTVGSKHYAAVFAGYPYTLGAGMKAYYICKIDEAKGVAVYKEITGTVPAKTPVLIECSSTETSGNVLTPVVSDAAVPADNAAKGVYFCWGDRWSGHYNSTKFEAGSMRVLALTSDGKLAATTSTEHLTDVMLKERKDDGSHYTQLAIPANSWYLPVSASAPSKLVLMSESDYTTGIKDIAAAVPSTSAYTVFTLEGKQVLKNAKNLSGLSKGIYIVNGKKVVIN